MSVERRYVHVLRGLWFEAKAKEEAILPVLLTYL